MRSPLIPLLVLFLLVIALPYVFATLSGGTDYVFGGFLINPQDGNSYLSKMYQGWRGEWRFTLPYTADPGQGAYIFLFYNFLGHIARWLGMSLVLVFHLTRLLGATLMAWALYRFLRRISWMSLRGEMFTPGAPGPRQLSAESEEITAHRSPGMAPGFLYLYALALFGSGLGWLVFLSGRVTSDFWVVEAYPFLSAYATPHFTLGLALLLLLLTPPENPDTAHRWQWLAGVMALLLAALAPFGVVIAVMSLAGLAAWWLAPTLLTRLRHPRRTAIDLPWVWFMLRHLAWVMLFGLPLLLYDQWVAYRDPLLAGWNAQNLTPAPPIWDLLLSLSPVLLVSVPGFWLIVRRPPQLAHLLCAWAGLGLLLVYLPFDLQRRFMMGLFVPLVGLAGYGIQGLLDHFGPRLRRLPVLLLCLSLPTNGLLLLVAAFGMLKHEPLLYLSKGESAALGWIETYTPPRALILSAPQTGLFIPAHTGRRVIYGHVFETVNAAAEEAAVTAFFQGQGAGEAFLQERQVDYVFYGPRERQIGPLPRLPVLQPVYASGGVEIYRVERSP